MLPSFAARSHPASLAFERFTEPEVVRLLIAPDQVRLTSSVPDCSDDPDGSAIPTAGSTGCRSGAGILSPRTFISTVAWLPAMLNVPASCASALPMWMSPWVTEPACGFHSYSVL